jgi:hypothetical protein
MEDMSRMTVGELREQLSKLTAELEEIEEERVFVLGQTGLHVSAGAVSKYHSEISRLGAEIDQVERLLRAALDK